MTVLNRFLADDRGATAIEYGLIAALIAVTLIAAFMVFGSSLMGMFGYVRDRSGDAMNNNGV